MENKKINKKIILMYDFFSEHGGIERVMFFQAKTLKQEGYDVAFAFAFVDDKLKNERLSDFEVIEYAKLPIKNETLQICSSVLHSNKKQIEKFKDASLIICHSFPATYFALRIKRKYNIPYIQQLHHPPQFLYNAGWDWASNSFKRKLSFSAGLIFRPFLRKFDKYCLYNADGHFTVCKAVKRIVKDTYGIDATIIYPAVDSEKFNIKKYALKELLKYNITKKFILGSGRIVRQKRFDYLIKAFEKLKNNKNMQLVLAGKYDETEKNYLESLIPENLVQNVLFLGPVELSDLIKIYNLAELTVLTCPKEWFGLVPIEAMACGCPVIAWKDNFGPEETVIDGKTGFLAHPYDINDFSNKIQLALEKKWNKKQIRDRIREFSEKEVSKTFLSEVRKYLK